MNGDLGQRISSLESLTANNSAAHARMSEKMDTLLTVSSKISATQDYIAGNVSDITKSINEHDDRIRSLENTRIQHEASMGATKRILLAVWTALVAVAGYFGYHIANTPPPSGPVH